MGNSISFRQKIFISQLCIFLLFLLLLYPIAITVTAHIQKRSLFKRAERVIADLSSAEDLQQMVDALAGRERVLFFQLSLFVWDKGHLYEVYPKRSMSDSADLGGYPNQEIEEALATGRGYREGYSPSFEQEMAYVAIAFPYQNDTLILQAVFPYGQIVDLTQEQMLAFLMVSVLMLVLFGLFFWLTIHYFTTPVRKILATIRPYQMGIAEHIPMIDLGKRIGGEDEFSQLAETFNALSSHIELHIGSLVQERNEKEAILESLIEGVIAVDADLKVIYMNRTAVEFLNIAEASLVGLSFKLAQQPDCETLILQAQKRQKPLSMVLKPKRGQKRFFDAVAAPRGEREGAILVLQDKTALYRVVELGRDFIANA